LRNDSWYAISHEAVCLGIKGVNEAEDDDVTLCSLTIQVFLIFLFRLSFLL
jgi:hypothetical protein